MAISTKFNSRSFDWVTIFTFVSLVLIGWLMLYAAVWEKNVDTQILTMGSPVGSQSIWIIISFIAFWVVANIDWKLWNTLAYPIYGISMALLLAVLIVGTEIKGARSWFRFGGISFQPSEFAKFATAIALAAYLSYYKCDLRKFRSQAVALGILLLPIMLTILQPDPGSALIFTSFGIVLYREGLSPLYYYIFFSIAGSFILTLMFSPFIVVPVIGSIISLIYILQLSKKRNPLLLLGLVIILNIALWNIATPQAIIIADSIIVILSSYYLWTKRQNQLVAILLTSFFILSIFSFGTNYLFNNVLKPHQQDRINVWLKPHECDPRGSLYNIIQSKTAIGSGGFAGKGYLNGTMTELNHVPEQTTDFIFSIIGEEQGFIGASSIILLFLLLLYRIIIIGERARNQFIRRYAYGLAGILFLHFFINIGMTMGISPVIGIPLPFLSKGGTALLFFSIMIGILVKMDYSRLKE